MKNVFCFINYIAVALGPRRNFCFEEKMRWTSFFYQDQMAKSKFFKTRRDLVFLRRDHAIYIGFLKHNCYIWCGNVKNQQKNSISFTNICSNYKIINALFLIRKKFILNYDVKNISILKNTKCWHLACNSNIFNFFINSIINLFFNKFNLQN